MGQHYLGCGFNHKIIMWKLLVDMVLQALWTLIVKHALHGKQVPATGGESSLWLCKLSKHASGNLAIFRQSLDFLV